MAVNPYEPPREPSPPAKARRVIAWLAILSVPAAGIAGTGTCHALAHSDWLPMPESSWLVIGGGWLVTIGLIAGTFVLERAAGTRERDHEVPKRLGWMLIAQVIALPIGIALGFGILAAMYMLSRGELNLSGPALLGSSAPFLVCAAVAAFVLWGRRRAKSPP